MAWGAAPLGWGDIGPLVDAKGAEVALAAGVGGRVVQGGEAAGEVRVRGEGDAALHAFEPMGGEGGADLGIGLGDALRVAGGGFRDHQIKGNGEDQASRGSSRIAARG